jgi:hypothetical protein
VMRSCRADKPASRNWLLSDVAAINAILTSSDRCSTRKSPVNKQCFIVIWWTCKIKLILKMLLSTRVTLKHKGLLGRMNNKPTYLLSNTVSCDFIVYYFTVEGIVTFAILLMKDGSLHKVQVHCTWFKQQTVCNSV